uniref:Odorant receptor n=1 Tax=Eriocrania semipurpurella TaxID=41180 RepID=A0A2H4NTA6_9NEOP|nr:odorant receptor 5 [Eriocrania semipurpurella]
MVYEDQLHAGLKSLHNILRPGGTWPSKNTKFIHSVNKVFGVFSVLYYGGIAVSELTCIINNYGDLHEMTEAATAFFTTFTTSIKLAAMYIQQKKLQYIISVMIQSDYSTEIPIVNHVHSSEFLTGSLQELKSFLDKSMDDAVKECKRLFNTLGPAVNGTLVGYMFTPLLAILYAYIKKDEDFQRSLPFPTYMPFNWQTNPWLYVVGYTLSIPAATYTAQGYLGIDWIFGCTMIMTNRQFLILENIIKNIDVYARDINPDDVEETCCRLLYQCMEHHDRLMTKTKEINNTLGFPFLVQFLCGSLTYCLLAFKTSIELDRPGRLVTYFAFFFAISFQLLLYTYYGEKVITLTLNLADAAYDTNWPDHSNKFKNCIRMLMRQTQRQSRLSALGFIDLCLPTFTSILSTAMSYFTLLSSMGAE